MTNGTTLAVLGLYRITVAELDALQLVFLGTVYWASLLVLEVPTGVVADVYSRKLAIVLATCLSGAALLIEGMFPVFWLILLGHFVGATAGSLVSGSREAWISDELGGIEMGPTFLRGTQLAYAGQLAGLGVGITLGNLSLSLPILSRWKHVPGIGIAVGCGNAGSRLSARAIARTKVLEKMDGDLYIRSASRETESSALVNPGNLVVVRTGHRTDSSALGTSSGDGHHLPGSLEPEGRHLDWSDKHCGIDTGIGDT